MKLEKMFKAHPRATAAFIALLVVTTSVSTFMAMMPSVQLGQVDLSIVTDKEVYQYGDSASIDVVLTNHGILPATINFMGYGGHQYGLQIRRVSTEYNTLVMSNISSQSRDLGKNATEAQIELDSGEMVFSPSTGPKSIDIRSSMTLNPGEKRTVHFDWGLYIYSSGGCTGPRFGNLVAPGNFEIKAWLNLDPSYGDYKIQAAKTIRVAPMSYAQVEYRSELVNSTTDDHAAMMSVEGDSLIVKFNPRFSTYATEPADLLNLTHPRVYRFENGFYYVEVKTTSRSYNSVRPAGWDGTTTITLSIPLKDHATKVKIGFFDLSDTWGWRTRGPVITEVQE